MINKEKNNFGQFWVLKLINLKILLWWTCSVHGVFINFNFEENSREGCYFGT